MKTFTLKNTIAALALALVSPAFVACSDNTDAVSSSVEVANNSYSINRLGGTINVDVKANGAWTAEVPEVKGELPWAGVLNESGNGNGIVQVAVDYFSPQLQKQERNAQLVIRSNGQTQTINLRQYIGLKEGETAPNANTTIFYDLWANKGLGAGYDITTAQEAPAKILRISKISECPDFDDIMSQTSGNKSKIDQLGIDTTMNNTVGLTVNGKLDVNWAKFKLNIQVDYSNKDLQIVSSKDFCATQSIVSMSSMLDVPAAREILLGDPDLTKKLFSIGFRGTYRRIVDYYNKKDSANFKTEVETMLANYGPAWVAGSEVGGSLFTAVRYDSLYLANNYDVKGEATAEMVLGPLEIKGGVSVGYSRLGKDYYSNIQHHITCTGGSASAITALTSLLKGTPTPTEVTEAADKWSSSIICSCDNNDNTSIVRITPSGIWQLFPVSMHKQIKAIAVEYYKGKKTCIPVESIQ